jgi:hypothetical protein
MFRVLAGVLIALAGAVLAIPPAIAAQTEEERSLNELRNTVVNLLQALVDQGVMTHGQVEALVRDAQGKAAADAEAAARLEDAEAGAVRVPYVPEIVKLEIRNQVAQDVKPQVVDEVLATARTEKWGIPGALPEWVGKVTLAGDVRLREQADLFAEDNLPNAYLDYNAVNDAGGIGRAGGEAFANTTEDRYRTRVRARLGVEAELGSGVTTGVRIATGNLREPVSTNQTLANMFGRGTVGLDRAFIRWDVQGERDYPWLTLGGGRFANPWFSTDLLYDEDISFDGLYATLRLGLGASEPKRRLLFLTLGGFPIDEVELSTEDKWLLGAQLGLDWTFSGGTRVRFAGAIHDYENIVGELNTPDSALLDFTAPDFLQRGNTLFDIRNDADPETNLFALAADYTVVDVTGALDVPFGGGYRMTLSADYVHNIAYDEEAVSARFGRLREERTDGYQAEIGLARASYAARGGWRIYAGYRYLERDAVLDAFTDSDFRLGGTDVEGYFFGGYVGLADGMFVRLRYLSGSEIGSSDPLFPESPPFAVDIWQLDFNAQF